ncbi:MAG TPA: hypothetical protein ENH28_02230 [Euryarchaeota archaeon]|nr:hypothetical protein BMS3Bbin15_01207 [archaeon BMS3Bbin15]HDL14965.1 hypothetical protein [Euryarchaeota archaeon]
MVEELSVTGEVKYILLIIAMGVIIFAISLLIYMGKISLLASTLIILAFYVVLIFIVMSFRKKFLI